MAERLRLDIPRQLKLYAVEVASCDDFSTQVSPVVEDAVKKLVTLLKKEINTNRRR
jgi:hypothetical protein